MPPSTTLRAARNRRHYLKRTAGKSGNCVLCGLYDARRWLFKKRLLLCTECFGYATYRKKSLNLVDAVAERQALFINIARAEDAEAAYQAERESSEGAPEAYPLDSMVHLVLYTARYAYTTNKAGYRTSVADFLQRVRRQTAWVILERFREDRNKRLKPSEDFIEGQEPSIF